MDSEPSVGTDSLLGPENEAPVVETGVRIEFLAKVCVLFKAPALLLSNLPND
jgi:hypothetical protein